MESPSSTDNFQADYQPNNQPDNYQKIVEQASSLFLENRSFVRFIALLHAPDRSLVDDIVNDVFIAFVEDAARRDLTRDVKPLLRTLTQRIAANHWQKQMRLLPEHLEQIASDIVAETQKLDTIVGLANADVERTVLRVCIGKLPARCKKIIERHYDDGIPFSEIAAELSENINTLYYQVTQIRLALKKCVQNMTETEVSID